MGLLTLYPASQYLAYYIFPVKKTLTESYFPGPTSFHSRFLIDVSVLMILPQYATLLLMILNTFVEFWEYTTSPKEPTHNDSDSVLALW